jgi:hypothetical protein
MRSTLLLLLLLLSVVGCRKPDFTYQTPCDEASRLRNIEKARTLTSEEVRSLDSFEIECKQFSDLEASRGKLWVPILATIAGIAAVIIIAVVVSGPPESPGW